MVLLTEQEISGEQERTFKQIQNNNDLVLITSYSNHSLYAQAAIFTANHDLTLVILPSSAAIQKEIASFKGTELETKVASLGSALFPNQARHLIAEVANGHYKALYLTPESFLYWFSSGFNSMAVDHYRKLADDDLGKQVFVNSQIVLHRVSRIVFCEFELFSSINPAFKPKYKEAILLIRELQKTILGLSFNCSAEIVQDFLKLFPSTAVIQERLQLEKISIKANFHFSKLNKQKALLKLLESDVPTLVYISAADSLSDLVNLIRTKLPNKSVRTYHKDLLPEHKADVIDYYLHDPNPTLLTTVSDIEGISRSDIKRLIHFSPPVSLSEYYRDLHVFFLNNKSGRTSESQLLLCEDDLFLRQDEKTKVLRDFNKDGIQIDLKKQNKQLLDWISLDKGCRWQNLELVLSSNLVEKQRCGICDLCTGKKASLLGGLSMFFLKNKFK